MNTTPPPPRPPHKMALRASLLDSPNIFSRQLLVQSWCSLGTYTVLVYSLGIHVVLGSWCLYYSHIIIILAAMHNASTWTLITVLQKVCAVLFLVKKLIRYLDTVLISQLGWKKGRRGGVHDYRNQKRKRETKVYPPIQPTG